MSTSNSEPLTTDSRAECSHTPAPWQVRAWSCHAPTTVGIESTDRPGWFDVVAECSGVGARFTREQDANARLIAAAPELLQALKEMVAISDRKHDAWDAAHAAIAKAEGRS